MGLGGVQAGGGTSTTSATAAGQGIMSSYAPFLRAGGAVLLRTGLLLGTKTLASSVAMRLGPTSMASHQVLMQVGAGPVVRHVACWERVLHAASTHVKCGRPQVWLFSSLAIDSLAIAGQVAVAVNKGKGDLVQAREVRGAQCLANVRLTHARPLLERHRLPPARPYQPLCAAP